MERWIVLQWDHYSPEPAAVVFRGSESECREAATEIFKRLPKNMDTYPMLEAEYERQIGKRVEE